MALGNRGTVGAVALDIGGNLAAGTSTGGITGKLPGRVSDSCIIGAGCYAANQSCAVSCTGDGEIMMREFSALSISQACCHAQYSLQMNCEAAVYRAREKSGDIGVIALNQKGETGIAFNSERMMRAWSDASGNVIAEIYWMSKSLLFSIIDMKVAVDAVQQFDLIQGSRV
ncbi:isoaspartyl peptidase/L-asparaginase [Sphingobacterium hotanense]|uniref:isoaspartyl peptidase/L-asparaginase n=1 Tax=Sphingobacterium hotanense TaxID=649196 RepID=UPI0021D0A08E|nr:isoaspartyl peptidase/L-asparaginase [Sphingobacterium hotanense]